MRYMIIVKAILESEPESNPCPDDPALLLDGAGLKPSSNGWRIRYDGERRSVIDGHFAEMRELIDGYTLIQVASRFAIVEVRECAPCYVQ
jgi:hypothetical protein